MRCKNTIRWRWLHVAALLLSCLLFVPKVQAQDENEQPQPGAFGSGGFGDGVKEAAGLKDVVDADGDGSVTDAEAKAAVWELLKLKPKTDDARAVVKALDSDGNNKLDSNEAATAVANMRREHDEIGRRVHELFGQLDGDDDERVSAGEFAKLSERSFGPGAGGPGGDGPGRDGGFGRPGGFGGPGGFGVGRYSAAQLGQAFKSLDLDKDNALSTVEAQLGAEVFARAANLRRDRWRGGRDSRTWQSAQQLLSGQDKDRDQRITRQEATGELAEQFAKVDTDADGKLTVAEVFAHLKSKEPQGPPGERPDEP
jgi:Ca2+-binding EF-hand superfamily protein